MKACDPDCDQSLETQTNLDAGGFEQVGQSRAGAALAPRFAGA